MKVQQIYEKETGDKKPNRQNSEYRFMFNGRILFDGEAYSFHFDQWKTRYIQWPEKQVEQKEY